MKSYSLSLIAGLLGSMLLGLQGCAREPDYFGIYTSRLDGTEVNLLVSDPDREMNHARLSPDRKLVTFTRYNHKSLDGTAVEQGGNYSLSEIMVVGAKGGKPTSLTPATKGVLNANGSFTDDGKSIIFVSNDNSQRHASESLIDLASGKRREIQPQFPAGTPPLLELADPHEVGNFIVFTALMNTDEGKLNQLWLMRSDGSTVRRLTNPVACIASVGKNEQSPGDYDPRLSPDGKTVAFMRFVRPEQFDVILIDIATGVEKDLSTGYTRPGTCDAVPNWSSDGKKLVFWHVDKHNAPSSGIWTMTAQGTERTRLALPHGFFYTMPAFFPGEGSGPGAHIIFSGRRQPGM